MKKWLLLPLICLLPMPADAGLREFCQSRYAQFVNFMEARAASTRIRELAKDNPKILKVINEQGWTDETIFYRGTSSKRILGNDENARMTGNSRSNAPINDIYKENFPSDLTIIAAELRVPSLNVSGTENYSRGFGEVLVQIRLVDLLEIGAKPYPDRNWSDNWIFTIPEGREVPVRVMERNPHFNRRRF